MATFGTTRDDQVAVLGEALPQQVVERRLHVEVTGERLRQRLADDVGGGAQRADEAGGALQHGARRQTLSIGAQGGIAQTTSGARQIDGDSPAVKVGERYAVALGDGFERGSVGAPGATGDGDGDGAPAARLRPLRGAQAFGPAPSSPPAASTSSPRTTTWS